MKALKTEKKYMLNARDNIIMTVINKVNKGINMFEETNNEFTIFLDILENKGIEYSKLSRALIPSRDEDKYEYAFVFNSTYFNDKTMFYVYNIKKNEFGDLKFNVLIELFENSERKNALISLKYIPEKNELRLITMF